MDADGYSCYSLLQKLFQTQQGLNDVQVLLERVVLCFHHFRLELEPRRLQSYLNHA